MMGKPYMQYISRIKTFQIFLSFEPVILSNVEAVSHAGKVTYDSSIGTGKTLGIT